MLKKLGVYIIFICSIGLFLGASFVLYHEYISYIKRVKRYVKTVPVNIEDVDADNFTNAEVNVLESFREQRNILLGHETFLQESVINYSPNNFSYTNILKENFSIQLENIKFTQPYWDAIITSFYTDISSGNDISLNGYDAIMRIPTTYENTDVDGIEDTQIIEKICTEEYWKRNVIDLDRTSQNIESIWKQNKSFFYTFMSKSKYDKLCKNVITDLVEIHEKIAQEPNHKEFYKTYNVKDSIFHTFPTTKYVNSFKYSWPFSFWDRRFQENNDKIVYEILNEIKTHYEN